MASIANLGHWSIEFILSPTEHSTGFLNPYSQPPKATKYRVQIRVARNGKNWTYDRVISLSTARVLASLTGRKIERPDIVIGGAVVVEQADPVIKVMIK